MLTSKSHACFTLEECLEIEQISTIKHEYLIQKGQILVEKLEQKSSTLWIPNIHKLGDRLKFNSIDFSCQIEALYDKIDQRL